MTRGKFVLLTENGMYLSNEFNGDMYYEDAGHGPEVVDRLKRTTTVEQLETEVKAFNEANFQYEDGVGAFHENVVDVDCIKDTYFGYWFVDYLYVKNADTRTRKIVDYEGQEHFINPNEIFVMCFGKIEKIVDSNGEITDIGPEEIEEITVRSFTVDDREIERLFDNNFISSTKPSVEELTDALHNLIGCL